MKIYSLYYNDYAHWRRALPLAQVGHDIRNVQKGDLVIFHGGTDISTKLYGQDRHPKTQVPNLKRDKEEFEAFLLAKQRGAYMFGICRGAQLFCALNGGTLKQHIDHHVGNDHKLLTKKGKIFWANSCHHQMMIPSDSGEILATTVDPLDPTNTVEPEIVYWKESLAYGVQGHPEWMAMETAFVNHVQNEACELWGLKKYGS